MGAPSQPSPGNVNTAPHAAMKGQHDNATTAIHRHPFFGDADGDVATPSEGTSLATLLRLFTLVYGNGVA